MKKVNKTALFAIVFLLLFSFNVSAEYNTDIYGNVISDDTKRSLEDGIDNKTLQILDDMGIDIQNYGWTENIEPKNVFSLVFDFLKSGGKEPFRLFFKVFCILLLCSLMQAFAPSSGVSKTVSLAVLCVFALTIALPLYSLIEAAVSVIKGISVFITVLVPVCAGVLTASGKSITAVSVSGVLNVAASVLSNTAAFFVAGSLKMYLALGICAATGENDSLMRFAATFKKVALWVFSLVSSVFLGILSIKGGVNSAADKLSMKTVKFVLSSAVPVAGSFLSQSISTVAYSLSLIKRSLTMYGVVALSVMVLPLVLEILCFRACMLLIAFFSKTFNCDAFAKTAEIFDSMLALLMGLLLTVFALFIISLGIVVAL